ncbi:Ankyrin repeat domain-containing protein 17 [Beauveria bassiana D1-5]|uniref:Ankyrin repeat domain-containing protein 17 n=1 Tax=Beauveria bassiana D1-5 TaxID=1245745 RepID=A0A0A2VHK0_BEABA|nr:Ankyrin repeat domain-containing protein 17 [Beauveria bassiana D1-5]
MLDHGADVNFQDNYIGGVLMGAARGGNESIFQMLLAHGATLMWSHWTFESELAATVEGGHAKMVQLVLEHAAEVISQRKISLDGALYEACFRGFGGIVDILLGFGANANAFCHPAYVVEIASWKGHINIMKQLLNAGADPNKGAPSCSPIYFATKTGNEAAVQLLLDRGADINALTQSDNSCAIHCAVDNANLTMVRFLVQNGANVNVQGSFYGSCLQSASAKGHHEMVEYLVQKGADVNIQGGFYGDALQAAARRGYHSVVNYLPLSAARLVGPHRQRVERVVVDWATEGQSVYAGTKAALEAMTRAAGAASWRGRATVNAVNPGGPFSGGDMCAQV